jgi:hypothetical protein
MIGSAALEADKLHADNRLIEAEDLRRHLVAHAKRVWPPTSSAVTILQGAHAAVLTRLKRYSEAEAIYGEIYQSRVGEGDQANGRKVLVELSKLYELWGQSQKQTGVQNLLSETHLPARLPESLMVPAASSTTASTTRPVSTRAQGALTPFVRPATTLPN